MLGKSKCKEVLEKALEYSKADHTEAKLIGENFNLTRFANSTIHQNMNRVLSQLQIRVIFGNKMGVATTNNFDDDAIKEVVKRATLLAKVSEDNPEFDAFPTANEYKDVNNFYNSTANYTAKQRAEDVAKIVEHADAYGFSVFGAHITTQDELAIMNTEGVDAYDLSTYAYLRTVVEGPNGTGYADRLDRDVSKIDADEVGKEAVKRCNMAQNPKGLETGEYEVVFLPYAVADIVRFPAYIGFGGQAYEEGRSYMAKEMGEQIMGENISIWDDPYNESTLNKPFDVEGVPKKKVDIIKNGVATNVVYSYSTAKKFGKDPTGHSEYRRGSNYEIPANLVMAEGNSSVEEMIKKTKKGLLVTRFHYTHCPEPSKVIMTGTTRDGLFYIEDGEIKYSVRNMRLTDSVLEMLSKVDMISKDRKLQRDWWSTFTSYLPAIHVKSVKWTGSTLF
ncbi:MAG: TldD/PmbA family protein [Clostridia bacterium]